jgi:hypothetical protein
MEEGSGNAFVVAEAGSGFADAVLALLDDPARAEALAQAGSALVRRMNMRSSAALLDALALPAPERMTDVMMGRAQ